MQGTTSLMCLLIKEYTQTSLVLETKLITNYKRCTMSKDYYGFILVCLDDNIVV